MGKTIRLDAVTERDIARIVNSASALPIGGGTEPALFDMLDDFYGQAAAEVGSAATFNVASAQSIGYLTEYGATRVTQINNTTRRQLQLELAKGVASGEGEAEIARRVKKVMNHASTTRAALIARTEVTTASNFARELAFEESGVVSKRKWISTRDNRTRTSHRKLHGQVQPLGTPFKIPNTNKTARHPGGFSDVGENANCRCVVVAKIERISSEEIAEFESQPLTPLLATSANRGGLPALVDVMDAESDDIEAYHQLADVWDIRFERAMRVIFRAQEDEILRLLARAA